MAELQTRADPLVRVSQHQIARKPVSPSTQWIGLPPGLDDAKASSPHLSPNDTLSRTTTLAEDVQQLKLEDLPIPTLPVHQVETSLTGSTLADSDDSSNNVTAESNSPIGPSKLAKAWEETKYFAGGLIHHPSESTKHYSVLRHSHGIVYYQGPETSVAVSIFADRPLPDDRKLWLQQKGWTGKTGWTAKQLFGANGGWLDVTPSLQASPEQLPKSCERAWQRDCKKFSQKEGSRKNHQLRETCIIRIPCEAEDGYFRIVLCGGGKPKNTLCPSPVFRVLSMSTTPSSMKGSSITTLPFEAGLKVFSMVANNVAWSAAQPVATAVQNAVGNYLPSFWETQAASAAYTVAGLENKISDSNGTYQSVRDTSYQHVGGFDEVVYDALDGAPMIGSPQGPQPPYPIQVSSIIVPGTGSHSGRIHGMPTANLKYVREEVTLSLHGKYFGWARISPSKMLCKQLDGDVEGNGLFPIWHPSIINVATDHDASFSVTYGAQKSVSAYLIYDYRNLDLTGSKIEIVVMGFLRENIAPTKFGEDAEEMLKRDSENSIADIAITQASLARANWTIEAVYSKDNRKPEQGETQSDGKIKKLSESMTERYVDARQAAQRQVDRVPIHLVGWRRNVDTLKEKVLGTGGIYVPR